VTTKTKTPVAVADDPRSAYALAARLRKLGLAAQPTIDGSGVTIGLGYAEWLVEYLTSARRVMHEQ